MHLLSKLSLFYVDFNICGYKLGLQPEETPLSKSDAVVSYCGTNDDDADFQWLLDLGAVTQEA